MSVVITVGKPGPSIIGNSDAVSGIVAQGVAVVGKAAIGKVYELYQPEDAEALGIDADYDTTNKVVVYRHITEFYRLAGKGTKLFFMLVPQNVTFPNIIEDAMAIYPRKLLIEAKGEIRQLAFAFNPAPTYIPTFTTEVESDLLLAIGEAQALYEYSAQTFRPVSIIIEGRNINETAANLPNLRDLEGLEATKVSFCIAQDYAYAGSLDVSNRKFADVGTLLGTVAKCDVAQNIGDHTANNISNATKSVFITAGISSHTTIAAIESQWATLDAKGYIFASYESGYDGHYWNNDHVCAPIVIDADGIMNEHSISLGRTTDKLKRLLRAALLPKVKTKQPVDTQTGKLPVGVVKYFDSLGDTIMKQMETKEEISGGKTYTDPNSDLITPPKTLNVAFSFVPYGQIGEIKGVINIKNQL